MPRLEGSKMQRLSENVVYDDLWKKAHALTKRVEKIRKTAKNTEEVSHAVDREVRAWMDSLETAEDADRVIHVLPVSPRQQVGGKIFMMKSGASIYVTEANPYTEFLHSEGDIQDPKEKLLFLSPGEADRLYEATDGMQNMDGLLGKEWRMIEPGYGMRVLLISPTDLRVKLTVDRERDVFTLTPLPSYARDMDEELKQQAIFLVETPVEEVVACSPRQNAQAA